MVRVLLCPYIYHARDLNECSSVTEMLDWVKDWISRDDEIHVTWLVPPKSHSNWDREFLMLDSDQVDAIVERRFMQGTEYRRVDGWREDELLNLAKAKDEDLAYWDVVINQNTYGGQYDLWRFMHEMYDVTFASGRPFYLVAHLHDFAHPSKQHGDRYPNDSDPISELFSYTYADSIWVKSGADAKRAFEYARNYLSYDLINELDEKSLYCGCAFDLDPFEREYSDTPEYIHIAGTTESEKNWRKVVPICELLYQRFDIKTIRTSMKPVEDVFKQAEWCETYSNASYAEYTAALERGDICFVVPDYATGGKTYFEQGASGQVMFFLKKPWVYDQMPKDYPFVGKNMSAVKKQVLWAVKNWSEAVAAHEDAMDYFEARNDKAHVGKETLQDLKSLEQQRIDSYSMGWDEEVLTKTMDYLQQDTASLTRINDVSKRFTDTKEPVLDLYTYTLTDMVLCLKSLGYPEVPAKQPQFETSTRECQQ